LTVAFIGQLEIFYRMGFAMKASFSRPLKPADS